MMKQTKKTKRLVEQSQQRVQKTQSCFRKQKKKKKNQALKTYHFAGLKLLCSIVGGIQNQISTRQQRTPSSGGAITHQNLFLTKILSIKNMKSNYVDKEEEQQKTV